MVLVGYTPLPPCFAQSIQSRPHKSGLRVRMGQKVLFSKNYCCKVFERRYLACLSWLGREFGFGVAPCFYYMWCVKGFWVWRWAFLGVGSYGTGKKAKAKCGGLSTPRRTMKLSVAPVEMTASVGWRGRQLQQQRQKQVLRLRRRMTMFGREGWENGVGRRC